jgi:hypothetical protein
MSEHEPIFPERTAGDSSPREITFTPVPVRLRDADWNEAHSLSGGTGEHCSERQIAFMASGEYLESSRTRLDLPRAHTRARAPVEGTTLATSTARILLRAGLGQVFLFSSCSHGTNHIRSALRRRGSAAGQS